MQRGTHKDSRKHVIFALYLLAYTTSSFPPPSRPYTFLASFFPSSYLPSFASYLQLYLLFTSFIPWLIPQWGDDAAYIALLHFTLWTMLGEIQILKATQWASMADWWFTSGFPRCQSENQTTTPHWASWEDCCWAVGNLYGCLWVWPL